VEQQIEAAFKSFLVNLSGLDDNLNASWIAPLSATTTSQLASATVRQANAILNAHEHGVGILRDDQLVIRVTGPTSASIADCQDQKNFYLVADGSDTPDPAITRANFVGAADLVEISGHWYVSVFTTTHTECDF
jgi:hypothetical protein